MKKILYTSRNLAVILLLCICSCQSNNSEKKQEEKRDFSGVKATIYTTHEKSNKQLQQSESAAFETKEQPTEFEPWIFIDTNHKLETFLGIDRKSVV